MSKNVALVDIQPIMKQKIYPNVALMKLSAFHKAQGDDVDLFIHRSSKKVDAVLWGYETIYASCVFNFIRKPRLPEWAMCGGTGVDLKTCLQGYKRGSSPEEVDSLCPDYDLYNIDYSLGFFTRGCPNRCPWCFVPEKEGDIHEYQGFDDFIRHDKAVLMDNNVLAHEHGITQIERIIKERIKTDFNQGLDARLIDATMARLLARVRWSPNVRLACDSEASKKTLEKAVLRLRAAGVTPSRYSVYTLITDNLEESYDRIQFVKSLNCSPYAQPYRDKIGTEPSIEAKELASFVAIAPMNKKLSFKDFYEYRHKEANNV